MVLGILTSIAACPAIIGTTEAVRQGQAQNRRQSHRGRKSNLLVSCSDPSRKARDIHGGTVVLRDKKVCCNSLFSKGALFAAFTGNSSHASPRNAKIYNFKWLMIEILHLNFQKYCKKQMVNLWVSSTALCHNCQSQSQIRLQCRRRRNPRPRPTRRTRTPLRGVFLPIPRLEMGSSRRRLRDNDLR
jgi:hypothetical protein